MKDGSRIPWIDGEPFTKAVDRVLPKSNLITMAAQVQPTDYMIYPSDMSATGWS